MALAIIKTGGKQYIVSPGKKIKIEKIEKKEGAEIKLSDILFVEKNKKVSIGTPLVKGYSITAKVLKQDRAPKIIVFKYKSKKRYRKKTGHRQSYTEIEILDIKATRAKTAKKSDTKKQ